MITIRSIQPAECEPWLLRKHYARRKCPISYAFGAYRGSELIGVVTYGMPASYTLCNGVCGPEWRENILELNRLCCESEKNLASIIVGRSLRMLPKPTVVVSFADIGQGHVGYIYQATNFIYTGRTDDGRKTPRSHRISQGGKHGRHQGYSASGELDTSIDLVYDVPKHRYIFFCCDKRQKRMLTDALNYKVQPYPKGESKRYDASAKFATQMLLL